MDECFSRFSHLSLSIFKSLDDVSIIKCRKINKTWRDYLDNQRFFQIRKIKTIVEEFHEVGVSWKRILKTAPNQTIIDLAEAVSNFYQKNDDLKYHKG